MDFPPILLKNSRGIVLALFHIYETCNKKLRKNSDIAIFENDPELNLGPKTKSFLNLRVYQEKTLIQNQMNV